MSSLSSVWRERFRRKPVSERSSASLAERGTMSMMVGSMRSLSKAISLSTAGHYKLKRQSN